jgi:transcriptional regulator with XRE-family HTH domain
MAEFNSLGLYLKTKRAERKMTQAEVAEALRDVHVQFVSNWERGLCAPPAHSFQRLIEVFKLDRDRLVDVMLTDAKSEIEAKVFKKKSKKK